MSIGRRTSDDCCLQKDCHENPKSHNFRCVGVYDTVSSKESSRNWYLDLFLFKSHQTWAGNLRSIKISAHNLSKFRGLLSSGVWTGTCTLSIFDIQTGSYLMFIGPCIILIVEERKTNLMSLAVLFHFSLQKNTTYNQLHQSSNTQRTENKTTDVVMHQHSRKLLMMDILMSETCWAHKKWNKIASDIKLVFHSSTGRYH
jgi:hypothetical protein